MKKHVPIEVLEDWLKGEGLMDYSITASNPVVAQKIHTQLMILKGKFDTYTPEQQQKAVWRARALVFAKRFFADNRFLGVREARRKAASELGCSEGSLIRWNKMVSKITVGAAFWPLLLVQDKSSAGLPSKKPKIWLRIQELLLKGLRPSIIASMIKQETGISVSTRTIHRIAKSEEEAGHLLRTQYINRFK